MRFVNEAVCLSAFRPGRFVCRPSVRGRSFLDPFLRVLFRIPIMFHVFYAGASVSLDTRFSTKMSRHFINILIVPTLAFKFETTGVCGSLDNNATNDLATPEGEILSNTDDFVESCKLRTLIKFYARVSNHILLGE